MWLDFVAVSLGGAGGCALRFLIGKIVSNMAGKFFSGTLLANLLGCFLMGVLLQAQRQNWISDRGRLLLGVGLLGGLTTLSSLSAEFLEMWQSGSHTKGTLYLLTNVIGGLLAIACGFRLLK